MNKELKDGYYWHYPDAEDFYEGEESPKEFFEPYPVEVIEGEVLVFGEESPLYNVDELNGKFIPIEPPKTEEEEE